MLHIDEKIEDIHKVLLLLAKDSNVPSPAPSQNISSAE